ncbi:MAG TPA: chitosanase [Panacibacter sp.]|nr:chitosanase [Panacibacter sp.]
METKGDGKTKDFFDKLSSLSGVFIAIAGFMATYIYNNNQISIQKQKTASDINSNAITVLEKCMKYATSENPKEREFGYAVFSTMGYEKLAINLIDIRHDSAGINVVKSIAEGSDKDLSSYASGILSKLSKDPNTRIKQVVNYFDKGVITTVLGDDSLTIEKYFSEANKWSGQLGIKTDLGRLIIYDTEFNSGSNAVEKLSQEVKDELNGTPKDGINEATWLKSFLKHRVNYLNDFAARVPEFKKALPHLMERINTLSGFLERGNYDLNDEKK